MPKKKRSVKQLKVFDSISSKRWEKTAQEPVVSSPEPESIKEGEDAYVAPFEVLVRTIFDFYNKRLLQLLSATSRGANPPCAEAERLWYLHCELCRTRYWLCRFQMWVTFWKHGRDCDPRQLVHCAKDRCLPSLFLDRKSFCAYLSRCHQLRQRSWCDRPSCPYVHPSIYLVPIKQTNKNYVHAYTQTKADLHE